MSRDVWRPLAGAIALAIAAVGLMGAVLAVAGYDAGTALAAFWRGSFGSWYSLTSATLVRAVPLTIAGLATTVAFRSGVLNIGVEGQLLAGAACATAVALSASSLGALVIPIALVAGAMGGVAWSAAPMLLKRRAGVLEVISTLMMNAVAVHLISWLVRGPLQEPTHTYPQSASIADASRLPILFPGTHLHAGILIAALLAAAMAWFFARTASGFRVRVTGSNPFAAASAGGIDVPRLTAGTFLASGALAGLAGAVEVHGTTLALYDSISPGYGYTSIAVALLARLEPRAVMVTAILFGALEAGASAMQRDAGVPAVAVKVVEALLICAVLCADAVHRRHRAAAGAS